MVEEKCALSEKNGTKKILEVLVAEGFKFITEWIWREGKIRLASLDWQENGGWLYAFVVNGKNVNYIGLTERILRSRMDNYRDKTGEQGERLHELIKAELYAGNSVSIYARELSDSNELLSEELRLRNEFKPIWNLV